MKEKQTDKILAYLQEHGSITPMDALMKLRCMRLGARIFDLRHEGYTIRKEMETYKSEDGSTSHYARYYLIQ